MINARSNFFVLFLSLIVLSACSSRPTQQQVVTNVANALVEQHQQRIIHISNWHIRGRIAFSNLLENDRNAATLSWTKGLDESFLRLSHPLRGTLAQLEQTPLAATLTDSKGEQHYAPSIDQLLYWQLGLTLPFSLVENAMTGKIPEQLGSQFGFYADGTLAEYQIDQQWHISLSRYQAVNTATGMLQLPHELEVTHANYKIRLQINEWSRVE